jgi:type II secretion system protein D
MIKQSTNWHLHFTGILGLCLGLALQADAQQRSGGGFSGGGFGGGGVGGGATRSSTSSSSASSTARQYPNNTTIGDAYFSIDPETRRVVYIADAATAKYISQVLTNLDRAKPQVLIKVVFLEVTHNNASDIGLEGGWGRQSINGTGVGANAVNGFGVSTLSSVVGTNGVNKFGQPISSFAPASPMTQQGAGLYQMLGQDYQVTLRAIAQAGNAKVLSRPSILARNNQPATITVGQQVPLITSVRYDNFGNAINSLTYQDVGVILKVTPFITSDGLVEMIVSPQISSIDPTLSVPISANVNAPVIDIRSADTVAVTADGQTVVIGGLIEADKSMTESKIPLLGDIPLLGNLFKRQQKSDLKKELIIFLTPHIVQAPTELAVLSAKERERSDATKGLTEQELNKFLDELPKKKASPEATPKSGKGSPALPPKGS